MGRWGYTGLEGRRRHPARNANLLHSPLYLHPYFLISISNEKEEKRVMERLSQKPNNNRSQSTAPTAPATLNR
jgi:hypothetical protein